MRKFGRLKPEADSKAHGSGEMDKIEKYHNVSK